MIVIRIGNMNVSFPDEESMMRVLKSAGIDPKQVFVIKRD